MAKGDRRKRGRPRKEGPRDKSGKLLKPGKFTPPPDHILERRKLFSFVTPTKGPDGRTGEIDQDVCDGLGQMCALGLLDDNGHDPVELRDKGRFWGHHYALLMKGSGPKVGAYERKDRSQPSDALTGADLLFDRMDGQLASFERNVLLSLIVDPLIGNFGTPAWAQSLIDEALLERGRVPKAMAFPTLNDRELLKAAIRGLCQLVDASLPSRWAA